MTTVFIVSEIRQPRSSRAEVAIVVHGPEACVAEADTFVAEHYRLERVERYLSWVCAPPYWVDVAEDVAPRTWPRDCEAMGYPHRAGDLLSE